MDKNLAGLLGAAAALTTMTAAQAALALGLELPQATSYRDLLDPIPNGRSANTLARFWFRRGAV
jgi:hypothetical protein